MSQETDQRPKIYNAPHDDRLPEPQPFTLTKLMHGIPNHPNYLVREGSCIVRGVKAIPSSVQEFETLIKQELDKAVLAYQQESPKTGLSDEQINRMVLLLKESYWKRYTTPFRAFRHVDAKGQSMADGMPYQGILTDQTWLAILAFDIHKITIIPLHNFQGLYHRSLFHDAYGMKLASSQWLYNGTLGDAISEFSANGFSLNQARYPHSLEKLPILPKDTPYFITMQENISIHEVLAIISATPEFSPPPLLAK